MTTPRRRQLASWSEFTTTVRTLGREVLRTPTLGAEDLLEPATPTSHTTVRATFLGVTTILLDDGDTAVLTDGFFSRPNIIRSMAGRVAPNQRRIRDGLARGRIDELAAVLVAHSHYDHALDSASVAHLTAATLLGSDSTRLIALGDGLPDHRIRVIRPGEQLAFGRFAITAVPSRHSPGDRAPGHIDHLLTPPAKVHDYKTGDCYSFHIAHPDGQLAIHPSAHYLPGAWSGHRADTIYLGIGVLGKQTPAFRERYWDETVTTVGARRVVLIHWDNFTRGLRRPLRPLPRPLDDIPAALQWLRQRCDHDGITLALPRFGVPVDPWG